MPLSEKLLHDLEKGPLFWFKAWRDDGASATPSAAAGVYSVWRQQELIYIGMSGRGLTAADIQRYQAARTPRGLATRLASHASGRRSGDQFCVYVADRLVLPLLSPDDVRAIGDGKVSLDLHVREFIHRELSYRFVVVEDGTEALRLEALARAGLPKAGKPLLNPR